MRGKEKFISNSSNPLIVALGIKFLETSTDKVQEVAKANNRTYKSLSAATNEGMAFKKLQPAVEQAAWDALYTIAGMEANNFRDKALKNSVIVYLNSPTEGSEVEYSRAA